MSENNLAMKYERLAAVMIAAALAASACATGRSDPLVKEAYRPAEGHFGVVPTIEYSIERCKHAPSLPEVLVDAKRDCPESARVRNYDCVDHSGKVVGWRFCEESRAPVLVFNIPFPYDAASGTRERSALSERIAAPYRARR